MNSTLFPYTTLFRSSQQPIFVNSSSTFTVNGSWYPSSTQLNNLVVGLGGTIKLNTSLLLTRRHLTSAHPAHFVATVPGNSVQFIGTTTIANQMDIPYMIVNGGATVTGTA